MAPTVVVALSESARAGCVARRRVAFRQVIGDDRIPSIHVAINFGLHFRQLFDRRFRWNCVRASLHVHRQYGEAAIRTNHS